MKVYRPLFLLVALIVAFVVINEFGAHRDNSPHKCMYILENREH